MRQYFIYSDNNKNVATLLFNEYFIVTVLLCINLSISIINRELCNIKIIRFRISFFKKSF